MIAYTSLQKRLGGFVGRFRWADMDWFPLLSSKNIFILQAITVPRSTEKGESAVRNQEVTTDCPTHQ